MLSLSPSDFVVTDPDTGDTRTYSLGIGPHSANFNPQFPNTLSVAQLMDVDLGQATEMFLEVIVRDSGSLQDKAFITVHITDINDNIPVFGQSSYTATIPGNYFKLILGK